MGRNEKQLYQSFNDKMILGGDQEILESSNTIFFFTISLFSCNFSRSPISRFVIDIGIKTLPGPCRRKLDDRAAQAPILYRSIRLHRLRLGPGGLFPMRTSDERNIITYVCPRTPAAPKEPDSNLLGASILYFVFSPTQLN